MYRFDEARWRDLEAKAHLPEAQAIIRRLIREGIIRVRPQGENGIQIIPVEEPEDLETGVIEPPPAPSPRSKPDPRPPLHRTRYRSVG